MQTRRIPRESPGLCSLHHPDRHSLHYRAVSRKTSSVQVAIESPEFTSAQ